MGLFSKVKDLFVEEVDDADDAKEVNIPKKEEEPIKKEVFKVEIKAPVEANEEVIPKKEEPLAPIFFDEADFETIEKPLKREEKIIKEPYSPKVEIKEVPRVFKPTPIISPVYGILDKNYTKEDITDKKDAPLSKYEEVPDTNIDMVRRKAYGTLEDDLETTLISRTSVLSREDINRELKKQETLEDEILEAKKENIDLNDSDLFNLIDSMYDKEDK